jgi:hypothetical protein
MADFESWLASALESLDLDGPTYATYVTGIMGEDEGSVSSRCDEACELLSGATDEVSNITFTLFSWPSHQLHKLTCIPQTMFLKHDRARLMI